ncbi:hypothetical protein H7I41_12845 [Mycobacterium manitobense]|uniref:CdiI immunity protein domain-containing protein n=1 Tax=[Mycobacterium] manitobense TaxID=190147 RepID=A0A9X2YQI2_9MYCO|nr:contact-dependent growth inhibition system immunity protein [[Mycobacterium] manitobense]MCV7170802.1 hypothetical protein [[Mycobacterium] manitobense]
MNDGTISEDLYQFFGAYFHQDWVVEADDWRGIVDSYVDDLPVVGPLRKLADEIDDLRETHAESDLKQFLLRTPGVCYDPDPLTYTEWLGQIADRLRRHAAGIDSYQRS